MAFAPSSASMVTLPAHDGRARASDDPRQLVPKQRPSFSAGTLLVPVAVRAIDTRTGKPLTDLQQEDFTVLEDGVPQQVLSFALQALEAGTASPGAAVALRRGIAPAPQHGRILAILLGRGRLDNPAGYVTGLLKFVRTRLLPQDQVAVFAYDRALPFTTDHQKVAETLERFRKSHEDVDFALGQQLGDTGMAPLYGNRVLPRKLQTKIDEMIFGPGAVPAVPIPDDVIEHEAFERTSLDQFVASGRAARPRRPDTPPPGRRRRVGGTQATGGHQVARER